MKELVNKIGSLIDSISEERGDLSFFCLALPEEAITWDILVAAAWIEEDRNSALNYLVRKVQEVLTKEELLKISGIILLSNAQFSDTGNRMQSETGWEETAINLYGIEVKKAYIFVASDIEFNLSTQHS